MSKHAQNFQIQDTAAFHFNGFFILKVLSLCNYGIGPIIDLRPKNETLRKITMLWQFVFHKDHNQHKERLKQTNLSILKLSILSFLKSSKNLI